MNQYFFKITKEEKENILDKHKSLYNGYATNQTTSNLTPLYTQDLANDKGGITVNGKGEVGKYNNKVYIKESEDMCEQCGSKMYEDEMEEGIYDVQDLNGEFDYTEEEMSEGFLDDLKGAFGYRSKPDKKPYVADAVESIISNMKSAKTERQLDSALQQYFTLIDTNKEDLNDAYIERIMSAYRRKADELGNYLRKTDIDSIMSDVEEDVEFSDDVEKIRESIQESLNWFEKFKKYN